MVSLRAKYRDGVQPRDCTVAAKKENLKKCSSYLSVLSAGQARQGDLFTCSVGQLLPLRISIARATLVTGSGNWGPTQQPTTGKTWTMSL